MYRLWRTSIETLFDLQNESFMNWNRIRYSLGMIVLALIAGSFLIIPPDTRTILRYMNSMLDSGLSAYSESQLPAPLRIESASWILDYQGEDYYLELNPSVIAEDKTSIRSIFGRSGLGGYVSVAAHFPGGGTIICTYQSPRTRPYCR